MNDRIITRLRRELRLTQLLLVALLLTTGAVGTGSGCAGEPVTAPSVLEVKERIVIGPNQELSLEAGEDSFELRHRALEAFSLRCEAASCTLQLPAGEGTQSYALVSSDARGTQLLLAGPRPAEAEDAPRTTVSFEATDAYGASFRDARGSARLEANEGLKLVAARGGWYAQLGTEDPPFLRLYGSAGNLDLRGNDTIPGTSPALEP